MNLQDIDLDEFENSVRQAGITFHGTALNNSRLYLVDEDGEEILLTENQQKIVDDALNQSPPMKASMITKVSMVEDGKVTFRDLLLSLYEEEHLSDGTKSIIRELVKEE